MNLIGTKPDSKGKENVLARARQLTEFVWTPMGDIPAYSKEKGKYFLKKGVPLRGMLYSSTEPVDKFVGENVSMETFCSVISNPDSALYTKDLAGHHNCWAYFGMVCNGLVRYALDIRERFSTKHWPDVPGMKKIADDGDYTPEQIQLCDILYAHGKGKSHVALITDILRDETGTIRQIEVSEALRPLHARRQFDLSDFFREFEVYGLWRYEKINEVSAPSQEENELIFGNTQLPNIGVDYGNKSNYRVGEEVVISAFPDGTNEIELYNGETLLETIVIEGRGKVAKQLPRGYYSLYHKQTGEKVEFCVAEPVIGYRADEGELTVWAESKDGFSTIHHMEFREKPRSEQEKEKGIQSGVYHSDQCASLSKLEFLTEEEKKQGMFTRKIPADAANFKVYFENKYGIWTHTMIRIESDSAPGKWNRTIPDSKGKENILARARQMSDMKWTPVRDVPFYNKTKGRDWLPAKKPLKGMLYSSVEPTDTFVGENLSFETFYSVIANPDSALYTKDLQGHSNSWAYFGAVCNGFVRHGLNIRERYNTCRWVQIPGMKKIAEEGSYSVERLKLCQILHAYGKGTNHVALITDILRDETGSIRQIEVSEALRPLHARRRFEPRAFLEMYERFALWEYEFADQVPMPSEQVDQLLFEDGCLPMPQIAVDHGNKSNYRVGDDIVISAFSDGTNEIELYNGETLLETIVIEGRGKVAKQLPRGYYSLHHKQTGEKVEFCVTEPIICYTVENGILTVTADAKDPQSTLRHMEFRSMSHLQRKKKEGRENEPDTVFYDPRCGALVQVNLLSSEEKKTGMFRFPIPEEGANFKVYFENKYGIWTHTMITL
ncbi:MAG: hypothetical protein E7399_04365 [Ruminococcaceae bacterium]|nr:hypothetical protein [Oscillospiraceae bacterium]